MEQVTNRVLLDAGHHVGEHVVPLTLVLDQGIALTHGPQADTRSQVVHLGQMLSPLGVDDGKHDRSFQPAQQIGAYFLGAARVRLLGIVDHTPNDLVGLHPGRGHVVLAQPEVVEADQPLLQLLPVPVLRRQLIADHHRHLTADDRANPLPDQLFGVLAPQHPAAPLVDNLTLAIHHFVVFEDALADLEVLRLHLALRALYGFGHHAVLDGDLLRDAQALHETLHPLAGKPAHEIVLQRQIEAGFPGIPLPTRTAPELIVDAARLVALGSQHVKATQLDNLLPLALGLLLEPLENLPVLRFVLGGVLIDVAFAQLQLGQLIGIAAQADIDAAAGHVGGHGQALQTACLRDDCRLPFVMFGVEHLVGDASVLEQGRQQLRLLDGDGADEHRLASLITLDEILYDGVEFGPLGHVHHVGLIGPHHRLVGRHRNNGEAVDLGELSRFGQGGPGHAGELLVHAEVVLQGDGGEGLVLFLDAHTLLRLDGLMQALRIAPSLKDAPGELVDDLDLAVGDDVIDVAAVQLLSPQPNVQVVHQIDVGVVVHVVDAEDLLDPSHALLRREHLALRLVHLVVQIAPQPLHDA